MLSLPEFRILSQIYKSKNSEIYRGIRLFDNCPVILKVLRQYYPNSSELIRYRQEYKLIKSLDLEGVVKAYRLKKFEKGLVIIFEDFGAESLKFSIRNTRFSLLDLLKLALKITDSLFQIHSNNIIHKDINPSNIVYNSATEQLKIIDFGIATRLNRQNITLKNSNILEGTLPYISPEQTGRMNRDLDYRTDFYSLGITLYELFTGQLPFKSKDNLELIHYHLAKIPLYPSEINPIIPPVVADIIVKLMAKNPEDRYQSAYGLKVDLENCLTQLEVTKKITSFDLASQDISDKLDISQKLYGRNQEVTTLLTTFAQVTQESSAKIMLIAGYSGVGKSVLVREIYKPVTKKQGYFIAGKCQQLQQNIPYGAIIKAFQQLVKQLLTQNQTVLDSWKTRLLKALGVNGQLMVDVIPDLELIIGKQSPVIELGVKEAENRFNLTLQKFIQACAIKEHPLVIFLDDLQWADSGTLNLINLMVQNQNLQYIFLIGAYRDNEINTTHPLIMMRDEWLRKKIEFEQIKLNNLKFKNICALLADTFKRNTNQVEVILLAELVLQKTDGNPFFVKQFLYNLYLENLVYFSPLTLQWQWNIDDIARQNITDNVIDLMIIQLKRLPESTQKILQLAACIGYNFDLHTLLIITGEKKDISVFNLLESAIKLGLILPSPVMDKNLLTQDYKFLHDRVQQAAYDLIPEEEKINNHLQIGELLLAKLSAKEREENLFTIVAHLNIAKELIEESDLQITLADLNLQAGIKAKKANAYAQAKTYLDTGIELLTTNCWQNQYQLTLNLYTASAEIAYLSGDIQKMEFIAQLILENAQTILDKIKIYELQIAVSTAQSQLLEAIAIGRKALKLLEVEMPSQFSNTECENALANLDRQLQNREIEDLINLPFTNNPKVEAIIRLLGRLYPSTFQALPELFPFQSTTMVSLLLQHGNTSVSDYAYIVHSLVLCSFREEIEAGYRFGRLAVNIANNRQESFFKSSVIQIFGATIQIRQEALRKTSFMLKRSYEIGIEIGDLVTAGYTFLVYSFNNFFAGLELKTLQTEIESYELTLRELKQDSATIYVSLIKQTIANLQELKPQPNYLSGDHYDESVMLAQHNQQNELTAIAQLYIYKILLAYFFGNYQSAVDYIIQGESALIAVSSIIFFPIYHFYAALTYLSLIKVVSVESIFGEKKLTNLSSSSQRLVAKTQLLEEVRKHQEIIFKWGKTAPMNHQHQWHLIEAEKQCFLGNRLEAIEHYELAIKLAKDHEFLHEEALANELTAQFYLDWQKDKIATIYLQQAHYLYRLWGATAKVKNLEQKYSELLITTSKTFTEVNSSIPKSIDFHPNLDLATVVKANQAIASEIILENLLETMMKILLENSGSTAGYLLLNILNPQTQMEKLKVVVEGKDNVINIFPQLTITDNIPQSLLNYVLRTQNHVILDHPFLAGNFLQDPYIQFAKPLSLLCYPLLNQTNLVGVVYLENKLTTGAFTSDRIQLLQLLSGQMAISLTNANLYREREEYTQILEEKVKERTEELEKANEELSRQAYLDGLTQIPNRRRFNSYLSQEWHRHLRENKPLAMILIDIDYFKRYNDHYGHQGGDDCLIQVAQAISQVPNRATDLTARYGGEEFAVILPDTDAEGALKIAESIKQAIKEKKIPHAQSYVSSYVTLSIGVTSLIPKNTIDLQSIIARADEALYMAKEQGRNQVVLFV